MVRIKHRYLLVNILYPEPENKSWTGHTESRKPLPHLVQFRRPSPDDLSPQLLARSIKDQIALLYGDYGVGLTSGGLNVKYLSPATSTAIIRCSRAHFRLVWAAISFMTELPKTSKQALPRPCVMQVVRVSGTIKKAEEEAIKRARVAILRAKNEAGEGATDGLDVILGQPDREAPLGHSKGEGRSVLAGFETDGDEDDPGSDSDGEG